MWSHDSAEKRQKSHQERWVSVGWPCCTPRCARHTAFDFWTFQGSRAAVEAPSVVAAPGRCAETRRTLSQHSATYTVLKNQTRAAVRPSRALHLHRLTANATAAEVELKQQVNVSKVHVGDPRGGSIVCRTECSSVGRQDRLTRVFYRLCVAGAD